jgi:2'-5' RNA ligase
MSVDINADKQKKLRLFIATSWTGSPEPLTQCIPRPDTNHYKIKQISPEQWHLTWAFLGQTQQEAIPALQESIIQVAQAQSAISGMIQPPVWWPHPKKATAIACPIQPVEPFIKLASDLHATLTPLTRYTQLKASKAFTPHLTIARLKPCIRHQKLNLSAIDLTSIAPQPWYLNELSLIQSVLTEHGPEYTCLFRQQLTGSIQ